MTINVVLADDHNIVRHALKNILSGSNTYNVVGEASTADESVQLVDQLHPDILVLDIGLPQRSGNDVILHLKKSNSPTKIAVLSMYDDELKVQQAIQYGADGYILKNCSPDEFLGALTKIANGEKFVPSQFTHLLNASSNTEQLDNDPLNALSPREREMFFLLVEGLPNRVIAKQLYISPRTVETHRARVIKKLNLNNNADLIRYAIKHGLVTV
ncbi:MAG: response regulator transcription factor [Deltaproteobacteria bacterium]|nr:response regulator transcription factor [Deltaproteobacteria bacterium]